MLEKVINTNLIVKSTPNNIGKVQKPAHIVFMADLDVIGDYKPVAHSLKPLEQDVFVSSRKKESTNNDQVSFFKRVAKFLGLK